MGKKENANRLARESSPYLLAHAYNPVDWYPWGEEALQKAEKEKKLLIVSIGYSSCHWCHVMEKESFNDPEVADVMNRFYVSVKVDREERPDIDQIYMTAAYIVQGTGGWPLNVIALPDGRPFFAGSYFPKERWIYVLEQFALLQQHEPQQLEEYAQRITSHIRTPEITPNLSKPLENSISELQKELKPLKKKFDPEYGGLKGNPKFPMPSLIQMLLTLGFKLRDAELDQHVKTTLLKMALGGIHDHVGGGFARYSVDPWWKIPHFEKMLYDNAQLLKLYAQAYARWKDPLFLNVCKQIVSFAQRGLNSPDGAYYASFDADSNGEEGQYYCWSRKEIDSLLGVDSDAFCEIFQLAEIGSHDPDQNILIRKDARDDERITEWLKILLEARIQKIPPDLDDKILTSWNALMITGLCEIAKVTGNEYYTTLACKAANFIKEKMISPDGMIKHTFKNGKASIHGFLDDYAFTIEAFLALYELTTDEKWILRAQQLNLYTLSHFIDQESKLFYYTSDAEPVIIERKMELNDHVVPSSNSVMAHNLLRLSTYFEMPEYADIAKQMMRSVDAALIGGIEFYANWVHLKWLLSENPKEVVLSGEDMNDAAKEIRKTFLPGIILLYQNPDSYIPSLKKVHLPKEPLLIQICKEGVCHRPFTSTQEAISFLSRQTI